MRSGPAIRSFLRPTDRHHQIRELPRRGARARPPACTRPATATSSWTLAGGIVDTDVKPVDRFPVEVAIYTCEAQYPSDPLELGYLSDAQEEYLYGYWSNETVPCLRAHGAVVADLPPVGQFGEGYEDVGALNPFTHLQPAGWRQRRPTCRGVPAVPRRALRRPQIARHDRRSNGWVTEQNVVPNW